jgi:hypothetical protein
MNAFAGILPPGVAEQDTPRVRARWLVPPAAARVGAARVELLGPLPEGPLAALVGLTLRVAGLDAEGRERFAAELDELLDVPCRLVDSATAASGSPVVELLFDALPREPADAPR